MLVWSGIFFGWLFWKIQGVRIAFGSCSTHKQGKGALWPQLADKDPDHLILLGDNIYADSKITFGQFIGATPQIIESQYKKLEDDEGFNLVLQKIGGWDHVFATWDDHDYGINNGDKSYQYKNESMKYFLEFFHQSLEDQILTRGGVYTSSTINITYSTNQIFQVKIILLDTRYFKDPRYTQDGDFLGETQWEWLEEELNDSTADVILLGSSIQILPTQKIVEESWSIFPHARDRLLRLVSLSPCLNVVLLSGDVHMAEVSQAFCTPSHETDFKTGPQPRHLWEFTSSGLSHTFVSEYRLRTDKSPPQERHPRDTHNYLKHTHILSRGYLADSLFNMYQATYPAAYREHRFKDQYKGVHFGTLDFILNDDLNASSAPTSATSPQLVMTIWNHFGEPVIVKTIPIHSGKLLHGGISASHSASAVASDCTPYWGEEKPFRKVLFVFCMAVFLFVLVSVPLSVVLWLVGTSVFYVCYEKEYKRREVIEKRYQEHKQQLQEKLQKEEKKRKTL